MRQTVTQPIAYSIGEAVLFFGVSLFEFQRPLGVLIVMPACLPKMPLRDSLPIPMDESLWQITFSESSVQLSKPSPSLVSVYTFLGLWLVRSQVLATYLFSSRRLNSG